VKRSSRSAFTLLELLLAIALIALLATALIGGSISLLNDKPTTPQEVFWQAVHVARKAALQGGLVATGAVQNAVQVQLSFDDKQKAFIADDGTNPVQTFVIPKAASDISVSFVVPETGAAADQFAAGTAPGDATVLPRVTFYSDGTCSPFHVQFKNKGVAREIAIDPWTSAQMLARPPAAATP
jgi:prepilin-type N-terminal cleavage/methylation domain-containing protein